MTYEQELAWAAGLFEGEGCFFVGGPYGKAKTRTVLCRLAMTDEDSVRLFHNIMDCGKVGLKTRETGCQQQHYWAASGADAVEVAEALLPFLCSARRRAKAEEMIAAFREDYTRTCPECGTVFESRRNYVYCSAPCRQQTRRRELLAFVEQRKASA